MATITTKSVVIKIVDPATGIITTSPGREWAYTTTDELNALATTVVPEQRETGGIVYTRVAVLNDATGVVTSTDTPLAGFGRDTTSKTVTGPAWAWYLLLALLERNQSDKTAAWLSDQIAAQTGLTLAYTPTA
jgi:hypothetical protein